MAVPKNIFEDLVNVLQGLGIAGTEADVFLYLLKSGNAQRISTIASKTKQNRTTLYGVLKSLSEKGLVSSVEDGGILTYRSIQPHLLVDYIERAKEKLSSDIERVREIVPAIEEIRNVGGHSTPSIQFFHGVEGLKQAYEDTITSNPSKKIYGFTGTDTVVSGIAVQMEWIEYYMTRRKKAGVTFFDIATASKNTPHWITQRDEKDQRVTKVLPPGYDFGIEIDVYENKTLFASFSKEHPLGILIEDVEIARTIKELFRYIDSTLPNERTAAGDQ